MIFQFCLFAVDSLSSGNPKKIYSLGKTGTFLEDIRKNGDCVLLDFFCQSKILNFLPSCFCTVKKQHFLFAWKFFVWGLQWDWSRNSVSPRKELVGHSLFSTTADIVSYLFIQHFIQRYTNETCVLVSIMRCKELIGKKDTVEHSHADAHFAHNSTHPSFALLQRSDRFCRLIGSQLVSIFLLLSSFSSQRTLSKLKCLKNWGFIKQLNYAEYHGLFFSQKPIEPAPFRFNCWWTYTQEISVGQVLSSAA